LPVIRWTFPSPPKSRSRRIKRSEAALPRLPFQPSPSHATHPTPHGVGQHGTDAPTDAGVMLLPAGSRSGDSSRISDPGQSAALDRALRGGGCGGCPEPRTALVQLERVNQPERTLQVQSLLRDGKAASRARQTGDKPASPVLRFSQGLTVCVEREQPRAPRHAPGASRAAGSLPPPAQ